MSRAHCADNWRSSSAGDAQQVDSRCNVKYVRRNFLCGLLGREPGSLGDLNAELRRWISEVANQRVHGTTHEQVLIRWGEDRVHLQPLTGRPPYPVWSKNSICLNTITFTG